MTSRIACAGISGRIIQGRVSADGKSFVGQTKDVTSDVLAAVMDKLKHHGGSFTINCNGEPVATLTLSDAGKQSAPVSKPERLPLESLEFVKRPVPSGWAVKRSDASRHEIYGFYDEYLGPLDGWLQDPRRAVLFGNKEAAIAAQAALSVGSKLAISVVWLVYDPVFDTYREQAQ